MAQKMLLVFALTYFTLCNFAICEPPPSGYGSPIDHYDVDHYHSPHDHHHHHHDEYEHEYNEPKAYKFGFQVRDDHTGNNYNRQEISDGNQVQGEYRTQLPDGRIQVVKYYADWKTGYHADVTYETPTPIYYPEIPYHPTTINVVPISPPIPPIPAYQYNDYEFGHREYGPPHK